MTLFDGDLAPTGNPISTESAQFINIFSDFNAVFLDSGTSALVLAILDAKRCFFNVSSPKVIIPGYCCPDLVSACVLAGVVPVVVDCEKDDPRYDADQLLSQLNDDVVAIIAPNFLGIASDIDAYQRMRRSKNLHTKIIEDNAQWFPVAENFTFSSDYCVFSFGRGKPISLLGGGLLLSKNSLHKDVKATVLNRTRSEVHLRLKVNFYNTLIKPRIYQLINRNPLVPIGVTKYHPREYIYTMDKLQLSWLQKNIEAYRRRWHSNGHLSQLISRYNLEISSNRIRGIPSFRSTGQWLRYPILFETGEQKIGAMKALQEKGLGASPFYPSEITRIEGIDGKVFSSSSLQKANEFSATILTLPVHKYVSEKACTEIVRIVNSFY